MCGIGGFSLSEADRGINSKRLTKEILLGIEHRGHDSAGFAYIDSTGEIQVHKLNVTASVFVKSAGRMSVPRGTDTVICHTRMATQGSPDRAENNHPIRSGHIVGVHNGWVNNDVAVWRKVGVEYSDAEVDSEAIFGAFAFGTKANVTADLVFDDQSGVYRDEYAVLEDLSGNVAVGWLNAFAPGVLSLARASASPLIVATTENGSLLFASEAEVLKNAALAVGLTITEVTAVNEGVGLVIKAGEIQTTELFQVPQVFSSGYRTNYTFPPADDWNDDYTTQWTGNAKANAERDARYKALGVGPTKSAEESAKVFTGAAVATEDIGPVERGSMTTVAMDQLSTRFVCAKALDVSESVHLASEGSGHYHQSYENREAEIDKFLLNLDCKTQDSWNKVCTHLHAFIRPGDRVTTEFVGEEVNGEVVILPQEQFPGGKFVLRLFINNPKRDGNIEVVLVERDHWEFKETNPYEWNAFGRDDDNVVTLPGPRPEDQRIVDSILRGI